MNLDIDKIKRRLLIKYPLFGSIVANTKFIEDTNLYSNGMPTAGTDGDNIYYHPDALKDITDDEQVFLFAHEVCHIAFDHIFRSEGKDMETWNIATDAVVNAFLSNDGLPLDVYSVNIPEAINYDAETMYQKLLKEKEGQGQSGDQQTDGNQGENVNQKGIENTDGQKQDGSSSKSNSSENQKSDSNKSGEEKQNESSFDESGEEADKKEEKDVGHDTHSMWSKAIEDRKNKKEQEPSDSNSEPKDQSHGDDKTKAEPESCDDLNKNHGKSDDKKQSFFDKIFNKGRKKEQSKEKDNPKETKGKDKNTPDYPERDNQKEDIKSQEIKRLTELGEKKTFNQNRIERKRRLEELRQELARESHGAGIGTDGEKLKVENIGTASPLIDWRKLLKEAVKYDVDWSYKNATIEDGVVTPYLEELPMPETEILLDTSGSISETLLRNFLRECKNILQNSKVKVGCFDDEFYGYTEIRNENDIDNMEFRGGGGTNFNVAVNAFTRRVENKIIFTDGDAPMPNKSIDAIWIVFGGKEINPPGGKVIYINEEFLNKLNSYYTDANIKSKRI